VLFLVRADVVLDPIDRRDDAHALGATKDDVLEPGAQLDDGDDGLNWRRFKIPLTAKDEAVVLIKHFEPRADGSDCLVQSSLAA